MCMCDNTRRVVEETNKGSDEMIKVILMIGLPGSGKSTVAEKMLLSSKKTVIVSRDSIREMVCGKYKNYKFTDIKEDMVKSMATACIEVAIERGLSVIVDETNFTKKSRTYWMNMISCICERKGVNVKYCGVWVDTPKGECIKRRKADPKGTNDNWAAIIGNMLKYWDEPEADEFDKLEIITDEV